MNFWKIADLWHTLMTDVLGYSEYAAGGCDVGALVTGQLGHKYADELYGIHIGSALKLNLFTGDRAWDLSGGRPLPDGISDDIRSQIRSFDRRFAVHLAAHVLDAVTRLLAGSRGNHRRHVRRRREPARCHHREPGTGLPRR